MPDNQPAAQPHPQDQPHHPDQPLPHHEQEARAIATINALPSDLMKQNVLTAGINSLGSDKAKQNVAKATHVADPDQLTSNFIWKTIVLAFAAVLIVAAGSLSANMLSLQHNADLLVTVFTTTVGFLGGLLIPSPIKSSDGKS